MLITIKHYDLTFNLTLNNKFTFLHDLSGKGKTFMAECLFEAHRDNNIKISTYTDLQEVPVVPDDVNIIVLDENAITFLQKRRLIVKFLNQNKKFLFISRLPMKYINYSYKDIYVLEYVNNQYVLKRKYRDYNCLTVIPDYTEDTGSGLDYYKQYFTKIQSTFGKDNIIHKAAPGSNIIADGCSIGSIFNALHDMYNWFLPESFEWLLLRKHDCIPDVTLEHNAEVTYFRSRVNLPYNYDKSKLSASCASRKYIADFEVSDSLLKEYLTKYNCDITIEELRKFIYRITGDYNTDEVIKIAIVMSTLERILR